MLNPGDGQKPVQTASGVRPYRGDYYHFIFLQRIELRIFAITFSIRKRPAKQKMIAKIVKDDQLAKNICYHFCVGQLAGAIRNDSISAQCQTGPNLAI